MCSRPEVAKTSPATQSPIQTAVCPQSVPGAPSDMSPRQRHATIARGDSRTQETLGALLTQLAYVRSSLEISEATWSPWASPDDKPMAPLNLCQQFGARNMLRKLFGSHMGPPVSIHRLVFYVIVVTPVLDHSFPRVFDAVACSICLLLMQSVE